MDLCVTPYKIMKRMVGLNTSFNSSKILETAIETTLRSVLQGKSKVFNIPQPKDADNGMDLTGYQRLENFKNIPDLANVRGHKNRARVVAVISQMARRLMKKSDHCAHAAMIMRSLEQFSKESNIPLFSLLAGLAPKQHSLAAKFYLGEALENLSFEHEEHGVDLDSSFLYHEDNAVKARICRQTEAIIRPLIIKTTTLEHAHYIFLRFRKCVDTRLYLYITQRCDELALERINSTENFNALLELIDHTIGQGLAQALLLWKLLKVLETKTQVEKLHNLVSRWPI